MVNYGYRCPVYWSRFAGGPVPIDGTSLTGEKKQNCGSQRTEEKAIFLVVPFFKNNLSVHHYNTLVFGQLSEFPSQLFNKLLRFVMNRRGKVQLYGNTFDELGPAEDKKKFLVDVLRGKHGFHVEWFYGYR